ncbi:hypothetical protein BASA81_017548 [Batrachochytrium salamandrivorans]|nr:hypothetical protein BASA81_017548 [Batrachochytrium salamandrivorans]
MGNSQLAPLRQVGKVAGKGEDGELKALHRLSQHLRNPKYAKLQQDLFGEVNLIIALASKPNSDRVALAALGVLVRLEDNSRLFREHPQLTTMLLDRLDAGGEEQVVIAVLNLLYLLANGDRCAKEMLQQHPRLIPLLLTKLEADSDLALIEALKVVQNLTVDSCNHTVEMVSSLLPVLLGLRQRADVLPRAIIVLYHLTCSLGNLPVLNQNLLLVDMLTENTKHEYIGLYALLALINLRGAAQHEGPLRPPSSKLQRATRPETCSAP